MNKCLIFLVLSCQLSLGHYLIGQEIITDGLREYQMRKRTVVRTENYQISRPITEQRTVKSIVNVPTIEYYYQQRGNRRYLCQRTVIRQVVQTRTVNLTRNVSEIRSRQVAALRTEPDLFSEYATVARASADLGSLPSSTEPTFDKMKVTFSPSEYQETIQGDDPLTVETEQILRATSVSLTRGPENSHYRFYVEAVPGTNKIDIIVRGFKLRSFADINNIRESDFMKADDDLQEFLRLQASTIKDALSR